MGLNLQHMRGTSLKLETQLGCMRGSSLACQTRGTESEKGWGEVILEQKIKGGGGLSKSQRQQKVQAKYNNYTNRERRGGAGSRNTKYPASGKWKVENGNGNGTHTHQQGHGFCLYVCSCNS